MTLYDTFGDIPLSSVDITYDDATGTWTLTYLGTTAIATLTVDGVVSFVGGISGNVETANANGGALYNEAASKTNPTLVPDRANDSSGFGARGANEPNVIVSGAEVVNFANGYVNIGDVESSSYKIYVLASSSSVTGAGMILNNTSTNAAAGVIVNLQSYDVQGYLGCFHGSYATALYQSSFVVYSASTATAGVIVNASAVGASVRLAVAGVVNAEVDDNATAAETRFKVWDVDNNTLERVSVGAADSGGAGYKVLRIPN